MGFSGSSEGEEYACNAGDLGLNLPWVGKIPWRKAWQPTPVFLPGECTWTEDLVGYSPWGCKELDLTTQLTTQFVDEKRFPIQQDICHRCVWRDAWVQCVCTPWCPSLCDHMDGSLPGSFVHGIFQARLLEQVAISYPMEPIWPRDQILVSWVSCIDKQVLYHSTTWEVHFMG